MMIWDLRKRQSVYTIPAHTNLISHVKFHGEACYVLLVPIDPYGTFSNYIKYERQCLSHFQTPTALVKSSAEAFRFVLQMTS